jgi:hypothetical protein
MMRRRWKALLRVSRSRDLALNQGRVPENMRYTPSSKEGIAMLEISMDKIASIVLMSRERERAEGELRSFLENLNEDELVSLVALMWIGRESYDPEDLDEAMRMAREEAHIPTADYLMGSPHLSDHLENGLDALGLSAQDEEDELMRGGGG